MRACILSADDEKGVLNYHSKIMKQYGFDVRQTTRLDRIKKVLGKNGIDCIHLDILFDNDAKEPDWDKPNGLSALGEIASRNRDIPIMVISGYIDEKAKERAAKYGLTNLIYKWYSKPADYEVIALDTIKAINEFKLKKAEDYVLKYINSPDLERRKKASDVLNFIPTFPVVIELKPNHLLDKLEDLSYKVLANFDPSDVKHFKEIVNDHAYEYFKNVSINHSDLAENLLGAISEVANNNLGTEPVFKLILKIIEKLKQKKLSEEEVDNITDEMEDTLNVSLGFNMDSPENVDRYVEHFEIDDEEE